MTRFEMIQNFVCLIETGAGTRTIVCEGFTVSLNDPLGIEPVDGSIRHLIDSLFDEAAKAYEKWKFTRKVSDFHPDRTFQMDCVNESSFGYAILLSVSREAPWPERES
jgi:hypothetical protein